MAKRTSKPKTQGAAPKRSKADAIRVAMESNPDASPADVAKLLQGQGFKGVTPQYVSTIKSMDKRKAGGGTASKSGPISADDLLATKEYLAMIGGASRAAEAIATLHKLGA